MSASNELEPGPRRLSTKRPLGVRVEKGDWATSGEAQSLPQAVGWGGFTSG
jgi:hypothetical protein